MRHAPTSQSKAMRRKPDKKNQKSYADGSGKNLPDMRNENNETNKTIKLICDPTKWEAGLHSDLERFYAEDKNFRVCIVSQSSTQALSLEEDLKTRFPHLTVKRLAGWIAGRRRSRCWRTLTRAWRQSMSSSTVL